jgi:PAS domain S-box-containing protein
MNAIIDWLLGSTAAPGGRVPWQIDLLAPMIAIDLIVAASFLGALLAIVWFLRRRPDLFRDHQLFAWLLAAFVVSVAFSLIVDIISIFRPLYGVQVVIKIAAALLFAATVLVGWPLLPALARTPSSRQVRDANDRLRQEVASHEATLRELEFARFDLEERVVERTNELDLVTARFRTALRGSKVHVFSQDKALRYTAVSDPMFGLEVDDIIGRVDEDIVPAENRAEIIALKHSVLESGQAKDAEISVGNGAMMRWYDFHIEPLQGASGNVIGLTCAAVDITERKEGEAHLRLLMRELTHRSKNLLAVVQAMARQTARHAGSIDTFLDQFSARLQAVATSHDLLIQESWYGVSLSELVRSQLGHYLNRGGSQVSIDGQAVILKPEVAQNLGLALHELATNAAKYGALSVPSGKVSINWQRLAQPKGEGVQIVWAESGGPSVSPPERRGFGSLVIERNLSRSLEAQVDLAFAPDGVKCRIVIPESQLSAAR